MKTVKISLNSIDKVKSFVNDLTKFDTDFDLISGRYVIDAKSIMGIFSLDLSRPIDLNHARETLRKSLLYWPRILWDHKPFKVCPKAVRSGQFFFTMTESPVLQEHFCFKYSG